MTEAQRRRSTIVAISTVFASLALTVVFGAWYTTSRINENNHKFCSTLTVITQPGPRPPSDPRVQPKTIYGRQVQAYDDAIDARDKKVGIELRRLAHKYNCDLKGQ